MDLIGKFAERKKATPAQIALAWVLAQKPWIVPIPGTTKLHRLKENIGAVEVELTPDDLREIDNATSQITCRGRGTRKIYNEWSVVERSTENGHQKQWLAALPRFWCHVNETGCSDDHIAFSARFGVLPGKWPDHSGRRRTSSRVTDNQHHAKQFATT